MVDKRVSLRYRIEQWRWIFGDKVKLLKKHTHKLLERFPLEFRFVTVTDFKTAIMNFIDEEK